MKALEINIQSRRYGQKKKMLDEIELLFKANPDMVIIGPNSPFNKYNENTYDGNRIIRRVVDYDDPWYVPIEWIIKNPERYQKLLEVRKKMFEAWGVNSALKTKPPVGKAIFISTVPDSDNSDYKNIWDGSESETTLKRFFIPAYKGTENK